MTDSETVRKFRKELNAGTMSLAVLGLLARERRALYGYELGMALAALGDDPLPINQGALYPVLRALEKSGLLTSHMQPSDAGPPRRYYAVTPAGTVALREWSTVWKQTREFVDLVLGDRTHERRRVARRRPPVSHRSRTDAEKPSRPRSGGRPE